MGKYIRRTLAIALSLTLVLSAVTFQSTVTKAYTLDSDEIASIAGHGSMTNLLLGKTATVAPSVSGGSVDILTDGNIAGDYCAIGPAEGSTEGASVVFDLGAVYKSQSMFEILTVFNEYGNEAIQGKSQRIYYSLDGEYWDFINTSGSITKSQLDDSKTLWFNAKQVSGKFRYLKIEYSQVPENGVQLTEVALLAQKPEVIDYMDVTDYKESGTYPAKEGQLFAGWYSDESFTIPYMKTTGYAYAKFIDEKVLTTKFQMASDGTAIRFVSSIDNQSYERLGFKFNGTYADSIISQKDKNVNSLFTKIKGGESEYIPSEEFCADSHYFFTYTVRKMDSSISSSQMTWNVTPYLVTLDGTTVTGTPGELPQN